VSPYGSRRAAGSRIDPAAAPPQQQRQPARAPLPRPAPSCKFRQSDADDRRRPPAAPRPVFRKQRQCRGRAAPSSKTAIDRRHANSCVSLILARYSTCAAHASPATRVFRPNAPVAVLLAILPRGLCSARHDGRQLRHIGDPEIGLVGTTADFRSPGPSTPCCHHLLGKIAEWGRIGEVRLGFAAGVAAGATGAIGEGGLL